MQSVQEESHLHPSQGRVEQSGILVQLTLPHKALCNHWRFPVQFQHPSWSRRVSGGATTSWVSPSTTTMIREDTRQSFTPEKAVAPFLLFLSHFLNFISPLLFYPHLDEQYLANTDLYHALWTLYIWRGVKYLIYPLVLLFSVLNLVRGLFIADMPGSLR